MAFFKNDLIASDITSDMTDASFFEGSGYANLCYPDDLTTEDSYGNTKYGNSYTAFFISYHEDTKLAKSTAANVTTRYTNNKGSTLRDDMASSGAFNVAMKGIAGVTMVSAGKKIGEGVGAIVGTATGISPQNTKTILGAGGAIFSAGAATKLAKTSPNYVQQKACIVLPTPIITSTYSMTWAEENTDFMVGIAKIASGVFEKSNNPNDWKNYGDAKIGGALKNAFQDFQNNSSSDFLMAQATKLPQYGSAVSKMAGVAANPRKEQIFQDVRMRNFQFTYMFAPRSEQEAKNVMAIIRQFKYHAHPEMKDRGYLYIYPSEFDIVHYFNGKPNPNLPRHTTSVLESVSVVYGSGDQYNVFENGMPTQITMTLQFKEIAILTKDDIAKGY